MTDYTIRSAISKGLRTLMAEDENVFLIGEDIGAYGGAYAVTKGFLEEFGERRIIDTPISESAIVGAAIGASMLGLKPIVEIMSINFSLLAMDQIVNNLCKLHYTSNGQVETPVIIRTVTGGDGHLGPTHSQCLEYIYASIPGLKIAAPSTPYDALGLLRSAADDRGPVMFLEHSSLYSFAGEVPDERYVVPFGKAIVRRTGADVTVIAYLKMVHVALEAAENINSELGKGTEVIDIRTLNPLDIETIIKSVQKTGRAIVVDEGWKTGGFASEISTLIQEQAFDYLDAPVQRVCGLDVPSPYSPSLDSIVRPKAADIVRVADKILGPR